MVIKPLILIGIFLSFSACQSAKQLPSTAKPLTENDKPQQLKVEQSPSGFKIEKIAIASKIENREPVDTANEFLSTVGELFCYTKVIGPKTESLIKHQWYRENKLVAEIPLTVKGPVWRTRSSKLIDPRLTGSWHVNVVDNEGKLLDSIQFTIH